VAISLRPRQMVFSSMPVILCQLTNAAPATVLGILFEGAVTF
jgi:hypothetical protein